jgi:type IV pilus assembly protein PilQ
MRLKQLLGIILSLLVFCSLAAAAGSQLTEVTAAAQGDATIVTVRASGAFTHTEYRPAENLLLLDLVAVSAAKLDGKSQALELPGVTFYRVQGYRGANGADVARIELMLAPNVDVTVTDISGGVQVRIATTGVAAQPQAKPATRPGAVQDISVARGAEGLDIRIKGRNLGEPKAMKLASPDRIVIDIPNAVPVRNSRQIAVNDGNVKAVRMARYQLQPPVTRVVVDLESSQEYEIASSTDGLSVKLRPATAAKPAEAAPLPAETPAQPPVTAQAQEFVVVEPGYTQKPAEPEAQKTEPAARAAEAVAKFQAPMPDVPVNNLPANASLTREPAVNLAMQQQQQQAPAAAQRPRYTGEPISVNLKDVDLKDFFRLIHEISGLNVVLDPNVRGTLTIVLDDVPWDQALDIVLKNNNLDKQVEGNVLRIATVATLRQEAEAQRARVEAEALAVPKETVTRYLSYARAKDLVPTIKRFLSRLGDVISDDRTNALIIQDIPGVFPAVDRLIRELDRKTQEVEIEARVVAATRSFARDIGTQFGFGWGNRSAVVGGDLAPSPLQANGVTAPSYIITGDNQIPLFSNLRVPSATSALLFANATNNYRIDFILTTAESRGLLKILSRPRIVTQNNIVAVVRQGLRIPIVTQAQLGGPPTVTYTDAFLRLTVTPQITRENTIFLNVDVENTTPDFGRTVSGNPTLITQQATTQVLVTDGGTVVIGGVIQTQNSVNVQQVPFLGDIPILGSLFRRRTVSTSTQELLFFITPKIIQT